jgi:hypothetical protein
MSRRCGSRIVRVVSTAMRRLAATLKVGDRWAMSLVQERPRVRPLLDSWTQRFDMPCESLSLGDFSACGPATSCRDGCGAKQVEQTFRIQAQSLLCDQLLLRLQSWRCPGSQPPCPTLRVNLERCRQHRMMSSCWTDRDSSTWLLPPQ